MSETRILTKAQKAIIAPYLREVEQAEIASRRARKVISEFLQLLYPEVDPSRLSLDGASLVVTIAPEEEPRGTE